MPILAGFLAPSSDFLPLARPMLLPLRLPLLLGLALPLAVQANDVAVKSASDAFGTSIGRESIGLYSTSSVRGFSPTAAGNVRVEGLYFDQVWGLSSRLRQASVVRVGLSAQGFAFPAPTGIADHRLRQPAQAPSLNLDLGLDHWGSRYLDLDFSRPIEGSSLALTGGLSSSHVVYQNGTEGASPIGALALWWRPTEHTPAVVFSSVADTPADQIGPQLTPADRQLPPRPVARRFQGPSWAAFSGSSQNHGVLLRHQLDDDWQLRAALFQSRADDRRGYTNLLLDVRPDRTARRVLIADDESHTVSRSGEVRLTWAFHPAPWAQRVHLQLAGRARDRQLGDSSSQDYGRMPIDAPFEPVQPAFTFGQGTRDSVNQLWTGLSYELRWADQLELNAGLQQTNYRKTVRQPGLADVQTRETPLLLNVSAAWHWSPTLAFYAGWTKGLEESGIAPGNASNRNQAMPAIRTSQQDAGLRWQLPGGMKLVAGLFEVRKPYYNLDASNLYTELGDVRHQGAEISLSGAVSPRWQVVAGAVLMRPRVEGEAVRLGRVGTRPVGQPETSLRLNTVWRPQAFEGLSLDAGLTHVGRMPATRDNRVELPAMTEVDLGLRQSLSWQGQPVSLRVLARNAFDHRSFELRGAGSYAERGGRLVSVSLSTSW
ncbi:MAG: TonB-dependent receptor [Burkholderiaceae bacterium]|nr:MAG: TonB-dependent receptor [Burkholderiaceae bacterium]